MIASAIRIALTDTQYIEGLVGLPLADMITDSLKMLSECTYHILCTQPQGNVPSINYLLACSSFLQPLFRVKARLVFLMLLTGKGSSSAPRIAALFMKANRNWLQEQLEIVTDHFSNE